MDDCNKCIELDESYLKGYTRRAQCLRQMGEKEDLEQAVRDLETAQRLATDRETARGLQAECVYVFVFVSPLRHEFVFVMHCPVY